MKRHTRDTIIAQINKKIASGKANNAEVVLVWMRLMLTEPEVWGPRFDKWCTKSNNITPADQIPDNDPYAGNGGR
jgi:hypothetical protein